MIAATYSNKNRTEELLEDEFIRRAENYLKKKRAKRARLEVQEEPVEKADEREDLS